MSLPPYTIEENGYIHGTWFCGRPIAHYYGAFPKSFWRRAQTVLRNGGEPPGDLLHWFSGTVPGAKGIVTVDGNPIVNADHTITGTTLPFADQTFGASFADPPYSPTDAKKYDLPYPPARKVLAEMARVTRVGGRIGLLHRFLPIQAGAPIKLIGAIGVTSGPQKAIRIFAIYERLAEVPPLRSRL